MASNNSSELTAFGSSFEVNSYLAVNACALIFFALPGLILNGLVAVALAGELAKKQGRAQWIILLNISFTGIVTTLSLAVLGATSLFLVNSVQEDATWMCRVISSVVHTSIAIRTASLALLSVVVYIIIKHGLSKVKLPALIASVVILWVTVVLSAGFPFFTPAYQFEAFRNGILICDTMFTSAADAHFWLTILFIEVPGYLISVCTVIAAAVYVKRNTVTDFNPIKRSLLRFSVVLLCTNILILITNAFATLGLALATNADVTVLVWLTLFADIITFLQTLVVPVLMMVMFKPIWSAVKSLLTCQRCKARGKVSPVCTTECKDMVPARAGMSTGPQA